MVTRNTFASMEKPNFEIAGFSRQPTLATVTLRGYLGDSNLEAYFDGLGNPDELDGALSIARAFRWDEELFDYNGIANDYSVTADESRLSATVRFDLPRLGDSQLRDATDIAQIFQAVYNHTRVETQIGPGETDDVIQVFNEFGLRGWMMSQTASNRDPFVTRESAARFVAIHLCHIISRNNKNLDTLTQALYEEAQTLMIALPGGGFKYVCVENVLPTSLIDISNVVKDAGYDIPKILNFQEYNYIVAHQGPGLASHQITDANGTPVYPQTIYQSHPNRLGYINHEIAGTRPNFGEAVLEGRVQRLRRRGIDNEITVDGKFIGNLAQLPRPGDAIRLGFITGYVIETELQVDTRDILLIIRKPDRG